MQEFIYHDLYANEDKLWRSVSTRNMLFEFWKKYRLAIPPLCQGRCYDIFELGPGAGATLQFFNKYGKVSGLDTSKLSQQYCLARGISNVMVSNAKTFPLKSKSFDLCLAVDVIEHIESPQQAINELYRVCRPGGLVMMVIPAFQFLWSDRDVRLDHYHRYTTKEIRILVGNAGFEVLKLSYINFFYFPILWSLVKIKKGRLKTDVATVPGFLNWVLLKFLDVETSLLKRVNFPLGYSTLLVAKRP